MQVRTFSARIVIRQGEHEHTMHRLIAARTLEAANAVADDIIAMMYSEPNDVEPADEDGYITVCGGELSLAVSRVNEIGLSTFIEMRNTVGIPAYCEHGVAEPTDNDLDDLKGVSKAVTNALNAKNHDIRHSTVLNALASAVGARNWGQYKRTVVPNHLLYALMLECSYVKQGSDAGNLSHQQVLNMANASDRIQAILDSGNSDSRK